MITKLRVGIPIIGGKGWLGGVSHMELHIKTVSSLPKTERPQLFLIVTDESLDSFSCYRSFISLFDGIIFMGHKIPEAELIISSAFIQCSSFDDLFSKIDFYFPVNFNVLPERCAASWIHDFQHRYLPEFFSTADIALRDQLCRKIAEQSRLIFCSSRAVETDFVKFYPSSNAVTKVLPLRIAPEEVWYANDPIEIQAKYQLPDNFILCSNQFWVHKNHRRLFEAIALLRQSGQEVHLVCTGLTEDFRNANYFAELQQYISDNGLTGLIHILGLIPRQDQIQLLRRCLFVVQPSLFEGLGLIVQECRALGKTILLSDLEVHLEHEYGIYFARTNVEDLTQKISALLWVSRPGPDMQREMEAKMQASYLTKIYAQEFCKLVLESQAIFNKILPKSEHTLKITAPHTPETVPIATSLHLEKDVLRQRQAIESWLKLGFTPLSFNATDEIAVLQEDFPDVNFIAVNRDARDKYNKPYVYVNDVLNYLDTQHFKICGIAPADVCLYAKNFYSFINKESTNSLLYAPRIDITSLEPYEQPYAGLGCIFLDSKLIAYYPQTGFCIGLPWWDYWAILIPLLHKIAIKKITNPLAYHITHPKQCSIETWISLGTRLQKYTASSFSLSINTIEDYQQTIVQFINKLSIDTPLLHPTEYNDRE